MLAGGVDDGGLWPGLGVLFAEVGDGGVAGSYAALGSVDDPGVDLALLEARREVGVVARPKGHWQAFLQVLVPHASVVRGAPRACQLPYTHILVLVQLQQAGRLLRLDSVKRTQLSPRIHLRQPLRKVPTDFLPLFWVVPLIVELDRIRSRFFDCTELGLFGVAK